MTKPITNHIHPVTVDELETIHAHVNGTFAPSSIAKEREAYASGQKVSANLFGLVAAAMPERNTKVLCNIDLSAPIEQLQAEVAALRVWAYGNDETTHQPTDMIPALAYALDAALEWIDAVPSEMPLPTMPGFDRDDVDALLQEAKRQTRKAIVIHQCDGCGAIYHDPVSQCDCMPERQTFSQLVAYPAMKGEEAEEDTPEANFLVEFIAGNPGIFNKVRTSPQRHMTVESAEDELSTVEKNGWRGWIVDKDGNRVKETTAETLWAKGKEASHD